MDGDGILTGKGERLYYECAHVLCYYWLPLHQIIIKQKNRCLICNLHATMTPALGLATQRPLRCKLGWLFITGNLHCSHLEGSLYSNK